MRSCDLFSLNEIAWRFRDSNQKSVIGDCQGRDVRNKKLKVLVFYYHSRRIEGRKIAGTLKVDLTYDFDCNNMSWYAMVPQIIDRTFQPSAGNFPLGSSPFLVNANNGTENCDALSGATLLSSLYFRHTSPHCCTISHGTVQFFIDFQRGNGAIEMEKNTKAGNDISAIYDVKFEASIFVTLCNYCC